MKRAIFKLGSRSHVKSFDGVDAFDVEISPEWLASDDNWDLELNESKINDLGRKGTRIQVAELRDGVSRTFSADGFERDFYNAVEAYYGYIIEKGFHVEINDRVVDAKKIKLLLEDGFGGADPAIAPYVYKRDGQEDGVEILVTVGLYRRLPSEEDEDQELAGRASSEHAGWTIICNDRVVLYADKTRATGWGEAGVPGYHTQFTAIAGVVIFKANDPSLLPLTTTKRGVDGNSDLYLQVKEFMREGTKLFTDYTNRWKKRSEERRDHQERAVAILPEDISVGRAIPFTNVRKPIGGVRYLPDLPRPGTQRDAWIRYSRPITEIESVSLLLFGHRDGKPSEVGEKCFANTLEGCD